MIAISSTENKTKQNTKLNTRPFDKKPKFLWSIKSSFTKADYNTFGLELAVWNIDKQIPM